MTTPKPVVTREHRELATEALMLGVSDALFAFEFAGETCGLESLEEAAALAEVIAKVDAAAEERATARVLVELQALVDAATLTGNEEDALLDDDAEAFGSTFFFRMAKAMTRAEAFLRDQERAEHINASEEKP